MKNIYITVCFILATLHSQAQSFGTNTGTTGTDYTYFGDNAGASANSLTGNVVGVGLNSLRNNTASYNTGLGAFSLRSNTTGRFNTATGYAALYMNTTGEYNTAIGRNALYSNTFGMHNTAIGHNALYSNNSTYNTAVGSLALYSNTFGMRNTAMGHGALYSNTSGSDNTALGFRALYLNATGSYNTAIGARALYSNVTGSYNTAVGYSALRESTASNNTAVGYAALYASTTGSDNTAVGGYSLFVNTTGSNNTAIGYATLYENTTGNNNTAIGARAGSTGNYSNTTLIGYGAVATGSNQVRLGNTSVTTIGGYEPWSVLSDERFKRDIKEDVAGLAFIRSLRPVNYVVDKQAINNFLGIPDSLRGNESAGNVRETGFIAQEVEKIIKDGNYVFSGVERPQHDKDHYRLQYEQFVMPLVKSVQEVSKQLQAHQKQMQHQGGQIEFLKAAGDLAQRSAITVHKRSEAFQLQLPPARNQENIEVAILDLRGNELQKIETSAANSLTIALDEITPGMYICAVMKDGNIASLQRFIVTD